MDLYGGLMNLVKVASLLRGDPRTAYIVNEMQGQRKEDKTREQIYGPAESNGITWNGPRQTPNGNVTAMLEQVGPQRPGQAALPPIPKTMFMPEVRQAGVEDRKQQLMALPEFQRMAEKRMFELPKPPSFEKVDNVGFYEMPTEPGAAPKLAVPFAPKAPEPSDIEKRAIAAGFTPGTPPFQEFIKTATLRPNSVTNVNMPDARGDVKYQEEMGKLLAQEFTGLQSAGTAAQTSLAKFDRLGGLLDGVNTGAFKGTTTQMKAIAKSAGVDLDSLGITDDVAPAQAAKAITNEIALQLRNPAGGAGMPGALSDKDREFLLQMVPGLENTPEGNKTLVDYWRRINKRNIEIAKMSRDYTRKNNGRFDYGFYDELADYAEKNSLFPEADKPAAPVAPQAAASSPNAVSYDYDYVPGQGFVRPK